MILAVFIKKKKRGMTGREIRVRRETKARRKRAKGRGDYGIGSE